MIDFHTHVLPYLDDGSRTVEETLAIIRYQYDKGIRKIVATPHFYPDDAVEVYDTKREEQKDGIQRVLQDVGMADVKLISGAEVLLSNDTWKHQDIRKLCIQGTKYILLEMPYSHWSDWVYQSVEKIIDHHKLIPIIAHVERYDTVAEDPNRVLPFIQMGALLQVNAYSMHPRSSKRKLVKLLLKHDCIHILGSDVHRAEGTMTIADGYKIIAKEKGQVYVETMIQRGRTVLGGEAIRVDGNKPFKKILGKWY